MAKRLMTVDDSQTVRQALEMILTEAGYEVVEAVDGLDALGKWEECPVDMLITDLHMPNLNGIELIKKIRQKPGSKFVPIIMLTSESQPEMKEEGKKAGASGWIVKPFSPEQLLEIVKMVCPS